MTVNCACAPVAREAQDALAVDDKGDSSIREGPCSGKGMVGRKQPLLCGVRDKPSFLPPNKTLSEVPLPANHRRGGSRYSGGDKLSGPQLTAGVVAVWSQTDTPGKRH